MKKKLPRRIYLLSAGLMLCLLMNATAMQAPQPSCHAISLEIVLLGGVFLSPDLLWKPGEPMGYKVTLNRTGNSELHRNGVSLKNLPTSGFDFVGQADAAEFSKLCQTAKDPKFESLGPWYGPPSDVRVSDGSEMTVTITADQATKKIYARNPYEPAELHVFQRAIIALAERIEWKDKSQKR